MLFAPLNWPPAKISAVGRERSKVAADKNLAVRLDDDDKNLAVGVRIETVERGLPAHRRRAARQRQADEGHQTESSGRM